MVAGVGGLLTCSSGGRLGQRARAAARLRHCSRAAGSFVAILDLLLTIGACIDGRSYQAATPSLESSR
jgi:hypothetical protein